MKSLRTLFVSLSVAGLAQASIAAEGGAIPQMDPTWYGNQLLWLAVSFAVLYFIVSQIIVPSVGSVLTTRKTTIDEAIAKAEQYKKVASQTSGDFKERAHEVHERAVAMVETAKAKAAQLSADRLAKLSADLEVKESQASARLQQQLKQVEGELQAATAQVAQAMVEKLLGAKVDAQTITSAMKKAA